MRRRLPAAGPVLPIAVLAALIALGPAASSAGAVKLTFIGDSKAAAINYSGKAKRLLSRGHDVRRDLRVCRRLVAPSCSYQKVTPRTALQAVRHYGTDLGRVLVIDVGYNDSSATYRSHLNRVMRAALRRGVKGVVWVNLRTVRTDYAAINRIIKRSKSRWSRLQLANWNRYSRGHPGWFSPAHNDGIHLTGAGAVGLVQLVRRHIPRAARGPRPGAASQVALRYTTTPEDGSPTAAPADSSLPVGSNLGGQEAAATGPRGILPLAGGAALMLFLVFVTLKRRGSA
ncbi:MAG: hypothetical protein ACRDLZ_04025 [Gaiellaceae bacterium]